MSAWIKSLASRIRGWLSPQQADRDFEAEIENHLDMLTRDYLRRGMTPDDATRAARVRLGGITQLKETNRELRGLPILDTLLQDTRYAVRTLRRPPA